jgi:hypothetical protein
LLKEAADEIELLRSKCIQAGDEITRPRLIVGAIGPERQGAA